MSTSCVAFQKGLLCFHATNAASQLHIELGSPFKGKKEGLYSRFPGLGFVKVLSALELNSLKGMLARSSLLLFKCLLVALHLSHEQKCLLFILK